MALALIFPGQGSQSVGMGRALYDAFAESRRVFDEVDEALGQKLSTIIFEGPEAELTLTANAQPALMAVSMAALAAMQARGFDLRDRCATSPGIRSANIPRSPPPAPSPLPTPLGCCAFAANAMQQAVPAGEGAMAAILGLELAMSPPSARRRALPASPAKSPTTMAAARSSSPARPRR